MFNFKPSNAQLTLWHALVAALVSLLLTVVAGAYQFVNTQGLDLTGLGKFAATAFVAGLSTIFVTLKNNPAFGQAEKDTLADLQTQYTQLAGSHSALIDVVNSLTSAPVQQPVQVKQPQPIMLPQPVQQQAFNPAVNLAGGTAIQNPGTILHFGDSQLIPVVNPGQ